MNLNFTTTTYSGSAFYKRVAVLFILFVSFASPTMAQWAKGFGGTRADYGQDVAIDANGNVFVTGNFAGTADFDPGPGVFNLTSSCPCDVSDPPKSDIFLSKYNNQGNFLWAVGIGGGDADLGQAVSVDGEGNVYITGLFWGTADFNPGPAAFNLTSAGNSDIFLAKFDPNGNFLWASRFGSILADAGYGLKVDGPGNVFVIGSFFGSVDFDPGAGTTIYNSNGNEDVFFAKYNTAGGLVWAKDIEGTGEQNGQSIEVDPGGNIYITGTFFGTSDFDPGPGTASLTGAGAKDPFFAKYNSGGNLVWARSIGSFGDEQAINIAVDASGNLYAAGYFIGTTDFDPGPGTNILSSTPGGSFDAFLLKLNAAGDFQWAFKIGNSGEDIALSVAVDGLGNPYICGYFQGTIDLDPGAGTYSITGTGNEAFFARYSTGGNFLFGQKEGGPSDEILYAIALDATGNIYLTGYFTGTPAFETGTGVTTLTNAGNADVVLLKFQPSAILPVNFISFTGKTINHNTLLQWSVASETNSYGYEIEKSNPLQASGNWQKIGFVQSDKTGNTANRYEFTDPAILSGKTLYRLKQVDADGHFQYSSTVTLYTALSSAYLLSQNNPNPAKGITRISYSLPEKSFVTIALYNQAGQKITVLQNGEKAAGVYELEVDCSRLKAGIYYYHLQANQSVIVRKMTVIL